MFVCRDATEHLTDEREGALSGWLRVKYRLHMTICPHCRAFRRQVDEALALARETPPEPMPEKVVDAAMAAFRARAPKPDDSL